MLPLLTKKEKGRCGILGLILKSAAESDALVYNSNYFVFAFSYERWNENMYYA